MMKLVFKPFREYIQKYTAISTQKLADDLVLKTFEFYENRISSSIYDGKLILQDILFDEHKIIHASCNCNFEKGPVCPHIIKTLIEADQVLPETDWYQSNIKDSEKEVEEQNVFKITDFDLKLLTSDWFDSNLNLNESHQSLDYHQKIEILEASINFARTKDAYSFLRTDIVKAELNPQNELFLECSCSKNSEKPCSHQLQFLFNLKTNKDLRLFFDHKFRIEATKSKAILYGLEKESNIEDFFSYEYLNNEVKITPVNNELIAVNPEHTFTLRQQLISNQKAGAKFKLTTNNVKQLVVFSKHKYYNQLQIDLFECSLTNDGKLKNPLKKVNVLSEMMQKQSPEEIKFFGGIANFQSYLSDSSESLDSQSFDSIILNPLRFDFYIHNPKVGESVKSTSIEPIQVYKLDHSFYLNILFEAPFYEVESFIEIDENKIPLKLLQLIFDRFILYKDRLLFIENPQELKVIQYFKKNNEKIVIHQSKFDDFQADILDPLSNKVNVKYAFIKKASKRKSKVVKESLIKKIYLSDSEDFIEIEPVIEYNGIEVAILSKKEIFKKDAKGNYYIIDRNKDEEERFLSVLLRQNSDFEEQIEMGSFYIHRSRFLEDGWFFDLFEEWREIGIEIYGFNQLKNNRYTPHKANVSVNVASGIDWFTTKVKLKFGNEEVDLKKLHKAVKNKSKYIELSGGKIGLLPEEWIKKFEQFFKVGVPDKNDLKISKYQFNELEDLFDSNQMDENVLSEIETLKEKLNSVQEIRKVQQPKNLKAELRPYQLEGLNWLNFLDEFNFGGCLADDMGLGKTIQIIAFLLIQKEKNILQSNLIVVPTSLIHNWEKEISKFAPSLTYFIHYGNNRLKSSDNFKDQDVVITTYGTLLSDHYFLKDYFFNYIILDESQAIKNPTSQRYKAVKSLQSRNKIVLTGTPVENNTFDLFSQFSIVCPGLLGNKTVFKDLYAIPIDKFKDQKRAQELQQKVSPFLLRRTKKQVAKDLPEKTEVVLYCEMGEEQRQLYTAYQKEFMEYLQASSHQKKHMDNLHILAGLTKLRQICNSSSLIKDDSHYGNESAKINVLLEEIKSKQNNHKILIFSQFVEMLDLIKSRFDKERINYEYLTGQTKDREGVMSNFQDNDDVRVFLISLKAGGVGLNLVEADYVYLVDPWWNPAVENQAIDRCYRIGQDKKVIAVRLITPYSIEEKIMDLQFGKNELINDLIKVDEGKLDKLNKDFLLSLINE